MNNFLASSRSKYYIPGCARVCDFLNLKPLDGYPSHEKAEKSRQNIAVDFSHEKAEKTS